MDESVSDDLLKSEVGEKGDAQKDGGYTTTNIRDHCQNLTVCFTYGGSGHILKSKQTNKPKIKVIKFTVNMLEILDTMAALLSWSLCHHCLHFKK